VLNGGLPAWQQSGGELETSPPEQYPSTAYPVPPKDESLVRSFEQMTELARKGDKSVQILDARSTGRSIASNPFLTLDLTAVNLSQGKVTQFDYRLIKC
jgi:3-mercaptopyruvate sulfurtransferase SseA